MIRSNRYRLARRVFQKYGIEVLIASKCPYGSFWTEIYWPFWTEVLRKKRKMYRWF
jgi:hypothetical protein